MIAGHPFLTQELDQLRSHQRDVLSSLPPHLLESCLPAPLPTRERSNLPERAESALRDIASRYMEEAKQLVADAHQVATADAALMVLQQSEAANPDDLDDLRTQLLRQQVFPKLNDLSYSADVVTAVRALIPLLVWADEVAGDYTDANIRRLRS